MSLPDSIQREIEAALQRTGPTDALNTAIRRIPIMFHILPREVEHWFETVSEADANKLYDTLDIIELVP